jgi:poly-gamma-glutamate synthesis protein (capsule biosynthesis protein)
MTDRARRALFGGCVAVCWVLAACGSTDQDAIDPSGEPSAATTGLAPSPSSEPAAARSTPTTLATTSTEPRRPLVIHAAGDVNLDPSYIPALAANGYQWALSGVDGLFVDDDLTLINLECTPSELGTRQDRPFNFRCDPAALGPLADDGVDIVSLANNHAMDFGPEGLVAGLGNVRAAGLEAVGAGEDRAAAFAPVIVERNGWHIAVLGFGGLYLSSDWLATDEPRQAGISDGLDLEATTAAVRDAGSMADLVIVSVHWCCELETTPNERNRAHAEAWMEAGADIVIGHHHHRLQPLDLIDGRPVAWGLGNFVWPRLSAAGSDTAVARIEVEPNATMTACLLPVTIVSDGHPTLDAPGAAACGPR